jgi:hypothetical protein
MANPAPSPARRETQCRGIADQRRAAFCPAIQANLADAVEIEVADAGQDCENPRTFPGDVGKDVSQRRFALLFVRRTSGRQVLVTKNEEKHGLVVAHGESENLSSRNPVAEVDEFVARAIAFDFKRSDVITE